MSTTACDDQHASDPTKHDLFKTGDPDAPDVIKDNNGEVVLDLCRKCGKTEIELTLSPECTGVKE